MDAGNAAQWAAVAAALFLGIRAEWRAKTHSQRELAKVEVVACSRLTNFLSLVIERMPTNIYDEDLWTPNALQDVLDAINTAIGQIAEASPQSASDMLLASDYLSELIQLRQDSARMDSRDVLSTLTSLYQQFRLLSIAATIFRNHGRDTISLETLRRDKYRMEFENRYHEVRVFRHKQINHEFKESLQELDLEAKKLRQHLASSTGEANHYD